MKFIIDSMLGSLARWLRLLGYDTLYYSGIEDRLLLRIAKEEDRVLLTRDTSLVKVRELQQRPEVSRYMRLAEARSQSPHATRRGKKSEVKTSIKYFLLKENNLFEQLKTVITAFNLKDFSVMSRCGICNTPLTIIPKEKVKSIVPQYVFQTSDTFKQCQSCGKFYWRGTHPEKFKKKLSEILSP